jgi:capsular exopolysaccharide synthesis family protein
MSRIDEALKRASGVALVEPVNPQERGVRRADEVLEYYPREARALSECQPSPEVVAPRVVAAPRTGARGQLGPFDASLEGKLVISAQTSRAAIEQYRALAATLHEMQVDRGLKTLMVTSALPKEGKTLTVANLALTLSESYRRRVLLIDADLRMPSIHAIFRLPNTTGLSDGLRSATSNLTLLEVSEHLKILPAGRLDSNPMAALTSERMQTLVREAEASFDWVLLDAPPVGLMPDANLLAGLTRAVLFVIGAGSTPYQLIERAIANLGRDCIVGTVLNRAEDYALPSHSYYQHYYEAASQSDCAKE